MALVLLALVALVALVMLIGPRAPRPPALRPSPARRAGMARVARARSTAADRVRTAAPAKRLRSSTRARSSSFAVGLQVLRLIDPTRVIHLPDGTVSPRTLITEVRYPALGPAGTTDRHGATAARAHGPFPLIVFGHGFAVTPGLYVRLLQSWARAGYVVAAPAFPRENRNAPGGPDESDLVNQPSDVRFVISRLLAATRSSSGRLAGLIAPGQVAVAGQSDGGDTALAVAYDHHFLDSRVRAAVILSGAEIPGSPFRFAAVTPPLLATQGTADTVNPPSFTGVFFDAAPRPKYLLSLLGAAHLPPYTYQQPQLGIVERVSTAFLDRYLKLGRGQESLRRLGNVRGTAALLAEP